LRAGFAGLDLGEDFRGGVDGRGRFCGFPRLFGFAPLFEWFRRVVAEVLEEGLNDAHALGFG